MTVFFRAITHIGMSQTALADITLSHHTGSYEVSIRYLSFPSYRKLRSSYPVSPEQFYSLKKNVSGSQAVKEIPARGPV